MKYNPEIHHRKSIRLRGYDYTQPGAYFITLCTQNRACLFGEIVDGKMILNDAGRVVERCWNEIPDHFPRVALDTFIIMPNHVHGILFVTDTDAGDITVGANIVGAKNFSPLPETPTPDTPPTPTNPIPRGTSKTIGSVIRGFKIGVTKWMRQNTEYYSIWQRNYYEHIYPVRYYE